MRMAIVYPASAALPKSERILNSPTQLVVLMSSCAIPFEAVLRMFAQLFHDRFEVMQSHPHAAVMTGEMPELVEHTNAAADVGRYCGARHAHLRKRSPAENEERTQHDVQCIRQPQRAHREHCIAGTAKDGVDEEDEEHRRVAAEHDAREVRAERHDRLARAHQSQNVASEEAEQQAQAR